MKIVLVKNNGTSNNKLEAESGSLGIQDGYAKGNLQSEAIRRSQFIHSTGTDETTECPDKAPE